jgi:hypothetical protein
MGLPLSLCCDGPRFNPVLDSAFAENCDAAFRADAPNDQRAIAHGLRNDAPRNLEAFGYLVRRQCENYFRRGFWIFDHAL